MGFSVVCCQGWQAPGALACVRHITAPIWCMLTEQWFHCAMPAGHMLSGHMPAQDVRARIQGIVTLASQARCWTGSVPQCGCSQTRRKPPGEPQLQHPRRHTTSAFACLGFQALKVPCCHKEPRYVWPHLYCRNHFAPQVTRPLFPPRLQKQAHDRTGTVSSIGTCMCCLPGNHHEFAQGT